MDEFINAERLHGDNKYQCSGCDKRVNDSKQWSIESAPRILMVDFVRYNFGKKNNNIIEYPKEYNLKKYMST